MGTGQVLEVNERVANTQEAMRLAKKRLREKNAQEFTASFKMVGDVQLVAGIVVQLRGFQEFDKKYRVKSAKHSLRPGNITGRQEREVRVYDLLDSIGVDYDRLDHAPAMTMEVCDAVNAAFGRMTLEEFKAEDSNDRTKHAIICKNLFLCNRQKTKFYLLMIPGDKKFLTKNLSVIIFEPFLLGLFHY